MSLNTKVIFVIFLTILAEGVWPLPLINEVDLLSDSIKGMSALQLTMLTLLPAEPGMQSIVSSISHLYKIKAEIDDMENVTTEMEVVKIFINGALNETCEWLVNSIDDNNFSCSREVILWLDMMFRTLLIAEKAQNDLRDKSSSYAYHNTCDWAKENIFCSDDIMLSDSIKTFMKDTKILGSCPSIMSC